MANQFGSHPQESMSSPILMQVQLVGAATWYNLEMLLPGDNGNNRTHAVAQPTENSKPYDWSWIPSLRDFNSRNASIGQTIKTHVQYCALEAKIKTCNKKPSRYLLSVMSME